MPRLPPKDEDNLTVKNVPQKPPKDKSAPRPPQKDEGNLTDEIVPHLSSKDKGVP